MKLSRSMLVMTAAVVALSSASLAEAQKGGGKKPPKGDKGAPTMIMPKPPEFTTGFVKEYNAATHQLTLNNGGIFRLSPMIADTPHPAGEKVKLRWTLQGIHRYADQVEVTMAAPASAAAAAAPAPAPAPAAPPAAAPAAPTG